MGKKSDKGGSTTARPPRNFSERELRRMSTGAMLSNLSVPVDSDGMEAGYVGRESIRGASPREIEDAQSTFTQALDEWFRDCVDMSTVLGDAGDAHSRYSQALQKIRTTAMELFELRLDKEARQKPVKPKDMDVAKGSLEQALASSAIAIKEEAPRLDGIMNEIMAECCGVGARR